MNRDTVDASKSSVELNDTDIPGAHLDEPLEAHNVAALRWWLLCRGINYNFLAKMSDHRCHRLSVPEPSANAVSSFFP